MEDNKNSQDNAHIPKEHGLDIRGIGFCSQKIRQKLLYRMALVPEQQYFVQGAGTKNSLSYIIGSTIANALSHCMPIRAPETIVSFRSRT